MAWKPTLAGLMLTLATSLASAQAPPAPATARPPPPAGPQDLGDPGVWRASDLIGRDVFTSDNQDVGEVNDLILGRNGRLDGLVIEIGGFLGLGEHRVAVPLEALRIEPIATSATAGTAGGLPPSTPGGADVRAQMRMSNVLTPARVVLNVAKDQLSSAPRFEGRR